MEEDTEPHDGIEQAIEEAAPEIEANAQEEAAESNQEEQRELKQVPLSAVQKERRKRQDAEAEKYRIQAELQFYKEQMSKNSAQEDEEDESQYETATKGELKQSASQIQQETLRFLEEKLWRKANPEKAEMVDENLAQFLKQRPNLASAVSSATNRYEEAFTLMEALTPRQQAQLRPQAEKKQAPGSPVGIPKGAAINQVVDVMDMSDEEYRAWRNSKRRGR